MIVAGGREIWDQRLMTLRRRDQDRIQRELENMLRADEEKDEDVIFEDEEKDQDGTAQIW